MLGRLHEAEMALGQRQRRVAQDRADDGQADRLDGVGGQPAVAFAADRLSMTPAMRTSGS